MTKNRQKPPLPPFLFPSQDRAEKQWMTELKRRGQIRSIGPRLYASIPDKEVAKAVRTNWALIVSSLFPGALLSHRSALEYRPSPEGDVFLTSTTNREIRYPGLTLRFVRGPEALEGDAAFMGLRASSLPRALLENLSAPKNSKSAKTLPTSEIERRLEEIMRARGEGELNRVRAQAREIARALDWNKEFRRLDSLIGALLGTRPPSALTTAAGRARAAGAPYDPACIEKLEKLFAELRHHPFVELREQGSSPAHFRNQAFFEAYFSNYIEGTTFEIEEAEAIVFDGKVPSERPKDAHDVLGTYEILSDREEARRVPADARDLEPLLKHRHHVLMKNRPEALPGEFKRKPNRAGNTHFVHPDFVVGTLSRGMELHSALPKGLARAAYIMFLITEVHPFADGNGRIARVFMNAELRAHKLAPIIIPTVYREDYLSALRAISRRDRPRPLIDMLSKAHRFSQLDFSSYPATLRRMEEHNWFQDADEAKILL
jgi:hypothetical protein